MLTTMNYGFWEFWDSYNPSAFTYGNHKVTFDGDNKRIIINPEETEIYVKNDIYSNWKEWVQVRENAKYLDALRTTGGDPVGGGLYAGDIYFTINGWKVVVNEQVVVNGIIYDDTPGESPFIVSPGGGVRNVVSNLAYAYNITGVTPPTPQEIRQEMDANSSKLISIKNKVDTINNAPSVVDIRTEIDTSSSKLISIKDKVDSLNNAPTVVQIRTEIDNNSTKLQQISDKQDQALTKGDFLALT